MCREPFSHKLNCVSIEVKPFSDTVTLDCETYRLMTETAYIDMLERYCARLDLRVEKLLTDEQPNLNSDVFEPFSSSNVCSSYGDDGDVTPLDIGSDDSYSYSDESD